MSSGVSKLDGDLAIFYPDFQSDFGSSIWFEVYHGGMYSKGCASRASEVSLGLVCTLFDTAVY